MKKMEYQKISETLEQRLDNIVIRMPKTYPAYFGTYDEFNVISDFTDIFDNLFLIGGNGMYRNNNDDHSLLTTITAIENICRKNIKSNDNLWAINRKEDYHEDK